MNAIFGLHLAVVSGQVQVVEFLLKGGHAAECVNKRDRRMDTPLHLAAVSRHEPIIQLLIDHGQLLLFLFFSPQVGALDFCCYCCCCCFVFVQEPMPEWRTGTAGGPLTAT